MPLDQFMIAPMNSGLQNDVKPFLIPEDAFTKLQNAYLFRGRVRKRFGSTWMEDSELKSRLRVSIGNTDGSGNISTTAPGAIFKIGQMFSIGDERFTVKETGTPGTMLISGSATLATYNTTSGAVVINGADAATAVYFYPAEPVMGLITYEASLTNDEPLYAFDTQFSYQFTASGWTRLGTATWTGDNSEFFWPANYRGTQDYNYILFVTNFKEADQMKYWDGSTWTTNFAPKTLAAAGNTIETARIIVPFKDRLLLFNTVEKVSSVTRRFPARCRFSQNGNPLATDSFQADIPGKGNFVRATTKEEIISVSLIKDRLIVFFERSTWELVYTGNKVYPFRFQQLNAELGVESTFSNVLFDKAVLGVGNVGIHACNGVNVERVDDKIPDEVFNIHNGNEGVRRVHGIRDYTTEMVYWTFPSDNNDPTFPNRVLVYNYKTNSWAFNDDSITTFGYYQKQDDTTWEDMPGTWQESSDQWTSGFLQSEFRDVAAGNQQGYVFLVKPDVSRNAAVLQITNMTYLVATTTLSVKDHNLSVGDYIAIENALGITTFNDTIQQVNSIIDEDTITIVGTSPSGTYTGIGTIARVSQIDIKTKRYNFYLKQGKNLFIPKVEFYVDRTANGEFTVDISTSSSNVSILNDAKVTGAILGSNIVETSPYATVPYEQTQEQLWHALYPQADGETIQLRLYLDDSQMLDSDIAWSDFVLNAMSFYAKQTSRL